LRKEILHQKSVSHHIMDTAIPLFATRGYAGVSVRELAKAAGVNNALISYYFGGKKELYASILSTQFAVLGSVVNEMKQEELPPKEKICHFAQQVMTAHKKYPYLIRLVMGEIINPTDCYDSIVKKAIEKINYFLRACIQKGIDTGDFKAEIDPAAVAIALMGIINFYYLTWPLSQELLLGKEVDYYIEQSLYHYLQGISSTN